MTLAEAVAAGHARVRLPHWANSSDYIKLDIIQAADDPTGRVCGPWAHLYSPVQKVLGLPRPQTFLLIHLSQPAGWEPYTGPPSPDEWTASITCPVCGSVSYNALGDVVRYCGRCHQFHDEIEKGKVLRGGWPPSEKPEPEP